MSQTVVNLKSERKGQTDYPRVYAALLAITVLAAAAALAISAPAWMPGRPGLATPHEFQALAGQTQARRAQQLQYLREYHWRDRASGLVSIPIDDAIKLMVRESQDGQP